MTERRKMLWLAVVATVLALAACEQKAFDQCAPGVGNMSRMGSALPPGSCK